jgi:hypothetical protein
MSESSYLRVTEILSPFSGLDKIDPVVLQNAANRGTRVHRACEAIIEDLGDWGVDIEIEGYIESFKKWWSTGHKVLALEKRFFCADLEITGQVDLILEKSPGEALIVDLKTSASPSKTWPLQGSAYAYMARKSGYNICGIQFIQLKKDGKKPKIYEYEDNFELFKKCLDIFNHFFRRKDSGTAYSHNV